MVYHFTAENPYLKIAENMNKNMKRQRQKLAKKPENKESVNKTKITKEVKK